MHLTIRAAWHDSAWTATVCQSPSSNPFCLDLKRIRESRNDAEEDEFAGREWHDLDLPLLPPCIAESAGFMATSEWTRYFQHPYQSIPATRKTHGHLQTTPVPVPPYSSFAVPFWWMLRENQEAIEASTTRALPGDDEPPFDSAFVFGRERQKALNELFFKELQANQSLVFYYTKSGNPLGDKFSRLIVGVGMISKVGKPEEYLHDGDTTYPLWDRVINHSIRPDGIEGFVLPYHEYLVETGDPEEDARRLEMLEGIAVGVLPEHVRAFSYGAELASADVALASLSELLRAVRKVREHGIASGPWDQRETWLNSQIARIWSDRGPFPGSGAVLESLGMMMGTTLMHELRSANVIGENQNPWPVLQELASGKRRPPHHSYEANLKLIRPIFSSAPPERWKLIQLLSRMDLTPRQANRWLQPVERNKATRDQVSDAEILLNPYRIVETDLGDLDDSAVTIQTVDRAIFPDPIVAKKHPIPEPSRVDSPLDPRRVRAALFSVLKQAAQEGDTLLSMGEAFDRLKDLRLIAPCEPSLDWLNAYAKDLSGCVEVVDLPADEEGLSRGLQLADLKRHEDTLRLILLARAERQIGSTGADWKALLKDAIQAARPEGAPVREPNAEAIAAQAEALERITTRRLSVLVGRAGTGKTSVLGAILRCDVLHSSGILLLAPTGKARVRLQTAACAGLDESPEVETKTVAQFLNGLGRYDAERQRVKFTGDKYYAKQTVIVDECSMLTTEDLAALVDALELGRVQRIILVGDPSQLPPIGAGRPFADLVSVLEAAAGSKDPKIAKQADALAELSVVVRGDKAQSDALKLANIFARGPLAAGAEMVLHDIAAGQKFNDLVVERWNSQGELRTVMAAQLKEHLGLDFETDAKHFDAFLKFAKDGSPDPRQTGGVDRFQILSPVRMHAYGVFELNRWMQKQFRSSEVRRARQPGGIRLGDEEIVFKDKVIQTRNQLRYYTDPKTGESKQVYLANGELGVVADQCVKKVKGWKFPQLRVLFSGKPNKLFEYGPGQFGGGGDPLELAYALTVHKAQGSEFDVVFLVLPKTCSLLSKELLYTALTRSKSKLILMIEGEAAALWKYTLPSQSETIRRNTNLFSAAVRSKIRTVPYAHHLIHRTERTDKVELVRSKSELAIANMLVRMGVPYEYEKPLPYRSDKDLHPDFVFVDPAGDYIVWEHLGMLDRQDYRDKWEKKLAWYKANGYVEDETLFITRDDPGGALDSTKVRQAAEAIAEKVCAGQWHRLPQVTQSSPMT